MGAELTSYRIPPPLGPLCLVADTFRPHIPLLPHFTNIVEPLPAEGKESRDEETESDRTAIPAETDDGWIHVVNPDPESRSDQEGPGPFAAEPQVAPTVINMGADINIDAYTQPPVDSGSGARTPDSMEAQAGSSGMQSNASSTLLERYPELMSDLTRNMTDWCSASPSRSSSMSDLQEYGTDSESEDEDLSDVE